MIVATVMYVRSATSAGMSFVNADSATPSGPHNVASGIAAPRSLYSWTALLAVMPPKNTASAPESAILAASDR